MYKERGEYSSLNLTNFEREESKSCPLKKKFFFFKCRNLCSSNLRHCDWNLRMSLSSSTTVSPFSCNKGRRAYILIWWYISYVLASAWAYKLMSVRGNQEALLTAENRRYNLARSIFHPLDGNALVSSIQNCHLQIYLTKFSRFQSLA